MKRSIRPFSVEVRGSRKGAPSWPALSEAAKVQPTLRPFSSRPTPTLRQDESEAPPAWAGARILPDLTPARPADDEQRLSIPIGVEEQRDEPEAWPTTPLAAAVQDVERRPEAVAAAVQNRAEPVRRHVERREEAVPANRHESAEISAAVGLKIVARARKMTGPASESTDKSDRSAFRRGERWKARLPAAVAQKHAKRRGKPGSAAE